MNPFREARARALVDDLAGGTAPAAERVTPSIDGTTASIRLYDVIDSWGGWWGMSAKEFTAALDALPSDVSEIRVLINSPGGEVTEGIAILNALRAHQAKTVAVVEGLAASAASFIAAGCDELVMMRGTELFIHNAWVLTWGDAEDLRREADTLEQHFDRNIAEVYADKSGKSVEHWLGEMTKDQFLNAEEAVAVGLADRAEGPPSQAASVARAEFKLTRHGRAAATPKPPASEPVESNRKENLVTYEDLQAGLRERLGVTDADASDVTLLGALDARLAEPAENVTVVTTVPEGTTLIDSEVLAGLQSDAAAGREAREEQNAARRASILAAAVNEGRIAPTSRETWAAQLEENEAGTTALLNSLPKNTIPVDEIGHSDDTTTAEDRAMAAAGWLDEKGARP